MGTEQNVIYLNDRDKQVFSQEKKAEIFQEIHSILIKNLNVLLNIVFDKIDDSLFDLAEKSGTSKEQTNYFDSMREFRNHRKNISKRYLEIISQNNKNFISNYIFNTVTQDSLDDDSLDKFTIEEPSLSLIGDEQLEQSLAVSGIASKSRLRFSEELSEILIRLNYLIQGVNLTEETNPLDPEKIIHPFNIATSELSIDINSELIAYKMFDKYAASKLDIIYSKINELFIKEKLLPQITNQHRKQYLQSEDHVDISSYNESSEADTAKQKEVFDKEYKSNEQDVLDIITGLIHEPDYQNNQSQQSVFHGNNIGGNIGANISSLPVINPSTNDLISLLSDAQKESYAQQGKNVEFDHNYVNNLLHDKVTVVDKQVNLSTPQSDIIDVVSMIFDFILNDDNLSDSIKATLSRLQIPVLKVAIIDKSFFSKTTHPARTLLNELAKSTIGYKDQPEKNRDQLFQKIESIVETIITDFENDTSIFDDLLLNFKDFLEVDKKRADAIEQRTRSAEASKVKVENAKKLVEMEINERIGDFALPESFELMLSDAWSKYLFITYLKEGEESDKWNNGLKAINDLIYTLTPKNNHQEKAFLLTSITKVQRELRNGLNAILYNPFEMSKFFDELEKKHIEILQLTDNSLKSKQEASSDSAESFDTNKFELFTDDFENIESKHQLKTEEKTLTETKIDSAFIENSANINTEDEKLIGIKPKNYNIDINPQSTDTEDEKSSKEAVSGDDLDKNTKNTENPINTDYHLGKNEQYKNEFLDFSSDLEKMEIGTWFEFTDEKGESVRAKLSAKLGNGKRMIFVNRTGFKLAEKSIKQLVEEINQGKTTLLDDTLLFDRALESVISNLRDMRS